MGCKAVHSFSTEVKGCPATQTLVPMLNLEKTPEKPSGKL